MIIVLNNCNTELVGSMLHWLHSQVYLGVCTPASLFLQPLTLPYHI